MSRSQAVEKVATQRSQILSCGLRVYQDIRKIHGFKLYRTKKYTLCQSASGSAEQHHGGRAEAHRSAFLGVQREIMIQVSIEQPWLLISDLATLFSITGPRAKTDGASQAKEIVWGDLDSAPRAFPILIAAAITREHRTAIFHPDDAGR